MVRKLIEAWVRVFGVHRQGKVHRNKTAARLVQTDMGEDMIDHFLQTEEQPDNLVRQQLERYAGELRDLFHKERRSRQDLADKNQQLEQRVRELTALNRLFQEHLVERYAQD